MKNRSKKWIFIIFLVHTATLLASDERYVIASSVNLRAQPNQEAKIVAKLPIGTQVIVLPSANVSKNPDWVMVVTRRAGAEVQGWLASSYLVTDRPTIELLIARFDQTPANDIENRKMWVERALALEPSNPAAIARSKGVSGSTNEPAKSDAAAQWQLTRTKILEMFKRGEYKQTDHVWLLLEAIRRGDVALVKFMIDAGVDVRSNNSPTPLSAASHAGQTEIVRLLLAAGANKTAAGSRADLSIAMAGAPNVEIARMLLGAGADVNGPHMIPPLSWAAQRGNLDVIKFYLDRGAHINAQHKDGGTALSSAVNSGKTEVVKFLLSRGAIIPGPKRDPSLFTNYTLLMIAAFQGHTDVARLLIERGMDVNAATPGGDTPLLIASGQGKLEMVKLLLDKGAKVGTENASGVTPIAAATATGNQDLVALLKDRGAPIDANLEFIQAVGEGNIDAVKMALTRGADPNFVTKSFNRQSKPALVTAVASQRIELVRFLLARRADPNQVDDTGMTPLMMAVKVDNMELVTLLLNNGASLDVSFNADQESLIYSPLHYAAMNGNLAIVKFLLDRGSNINVQGHSSVEGDVGPPLLYAVSKGHFDIARYLVERGADVNLTNYQGIGPLAVAKRNGHGPMIALLEKAGAVDRSNGGW